MDLHSGDLYWPVKNGMINSFPSLNHDIKTDVVIIGEGISGALAGYYLVRNNINITLIDKRDAGSGSTCASTCLLQYEIDTPLLSLIEKVGKENAVQSYLLCRDSIYKLQDIARQIKSNCEFEIKKSLLCASLKKDIDKLKIEHTERKNAGIEVDFLQGEELNKEYFINAPAAILSKDGAQMNAYLFTQELLQWIKNKGGNIYDKTEAVKINYNKNKVRIITSNGSSIEASHLIFANGYEAQNYLSENYGRLHSTYVVASEQQAERPFDFILWETARPYMYMRTTSDNRIIAGGKDEVFYSPGKRDKLLRSKSREIAKSVLKKFPRLQFIPDYCWTGTFAGTKDGLPYIGHHKEHPRGFFSMGYGGNGITFSLIAAEIISDAILKKKNPYEHIFSFYR